jgi:hypothetical protein
MPAKTIVSSLFVFGKDKTASAQKYFYRGSSSLTVRLINQQSFAQKTMHNARCKMHNLKVISSLASQMVQGSNYTARDKV